MRGGTCLQFPGLDMALEGLDQALVRPAIFGPNGPLCEPPVRL